MVGDCCEDLFFTCKVASLSGSVGEQLIAGLPLALQGRASSEFKILRDGLSRFRPFLVRGLTYLWDDFRYCAALTALLAKLVQLDVSEQRAMSLLKPSVLSKREDIQSFVDRLVAVPKSERWFIDLDEIVNFPHLLQIWCNYFSLET
ncbi:MAG: hypothetical protein LBE76_01485 [Nitrososphaerota archaeon]|nr:hypothetical protein [Nitrososphaerota archaeon]